MEVITKIRVNDGFALLIKANPDNAKSKENKYEIYLTNRENG